MRRKQCEQIRQCYPYPQRCRNRQYGLRALPNGLLVCNQHWDAYLENAPPAPYYVSKGTPLTPRLAAAILDDFERHGGWCRPRNTLDKAKRGTGWRVREGAC